MNTRPGEKIQPIVVATPQFLWENIGNLTASQAEPIVTARGYAAMWTTLTDAKTIRWTVPNDVTGCFFRFHTKAAADNHKPQIWVAAGATYRDGVTEDQFMLGCELDITGGTQTGPKTNVFCDTMVKTAATGVLDEGDVLDSGANERVAMYRCDLQGYKKIVIIAPTFEAGTTLYADARGY